MKSKIFLLLTVLAVMLGSIAAVAQETEDDETTPDANTGFVATISDESIDEEAPDAEAETLYIRYHVCSLNADADDECNKTLAEGFDAEGFDGWTEIAVESNEDGEYNHGSFVSAFAREFDGGPGKGCVLRFIAQSNWGKEEVDTEGDEDILIQAQTFCAFNTTNGDAESVEGEEDEGNGPPPWAGNGKPPWAGGDDDEVESSSEDAGGPPPWAGKPGGPKNANK